MGLPQIFHRIGDAVHGHVEFDGKHTVRNAQDARKVLHLHGAADFEQFDGLGVDVE